MKKVYLDNAATTYVSTEALAEMLPCFNASYGNPSSTHAFGREAEAVVDKARDRIAKAISADKSGEIYFTSGGTEANNWAMFGLARANKSKGKHIITSGIEHHSVLDSLKQLEKEGFEITILPADKYGVVSLASLLHHIRKDTILISVISVSNELGTIQNIKAIGKTAREKGIIFHTDATQAIGCLKIDVVDMAIDVLTMSSHKIYGPKGVGALYVRNGISINNIIFGGEQERTKRGGTLNAPAIAGFGKAAEVAIREMSANTQKLKSIRNYIVTNLTRNIEDVTINGHPQQAIPSIISATFHRVDGESLSVLLDMEGVSVSTGSACVSHAIAKSHVLEAIGLNELDSKSTIRISFAKSITKDEVTYALDKIEKSVKKLRKASPITKATRR
jgi:cysteine desulfurase